MNIYLVLETLDYDGERVHGVFSTEDKATHYIINSPKWLSRHLQIIEYEVDELSK